MRAARRTTPSPPGSTPSAWHPAYAHAVIVSHRVASPALISSGDRQVRSFVRTMSGMVRRCSRQYRARSAAVAIGNGSRALRASGGSSSRTTNPPPTE